MNIGKLKINNNGIYSSKWDFYEYARHSIRWSMDSVSSMMGAMGSNALLSEVPYIKTDNFYMQLLAAHTAAYWQYLYFSEIVPHNLLTESMTEQKRGLDDGINAITFGEDKIDPYFVDLYHHFFRKYLRGIMDDCSQINDVDPEAFNPDVNNFTQAFMEDSKALSLRDNQVEIDEVKSSYLGHLIAVIPLGVFESLSKMTVEYIPPKKGFFNI